jgi:hypothetical protein
VLWSCDFAGDLMNLMCNWYGLELVIAMADAIGIAEV